MLDYCTEALVLDKEEAGDFDLRAFLYTKSSGKLIAKATSGRKIVSKLASHLEPANFVKIRLVGSNGEYLQIADALKFSSLPKSSQTVKILQLLKEITVTGQPDDELWSLLTGGDPTNGRILKTLGFDSQFAVCQICSGEKPNHFSLEDLSYLCWPCFKKSGCPRSFVLE